MPGRLKLAITLALAGLIVGATPVFASNDSHGRTPMARYTGKVQNLVLHDTTAGRQSSFVIELTQQADLSKAYAMKDQDARGWYVYRTLKRTAEKTQGPLKAMLDAQGVSYKSFWVANEIVVHQGSRALVDNLAGRADVKLIEANDASNWLESTAGVELDSLAILKADRPNTIEPGPVQVHAPDLWNLGFTGTGIVVGNQDTGMRWTHNAIKPHYRGWNGSNADHNYNWHDSIHGPIGGQGQNPCGYDTQAPCDDHGHGTHTTGLAVGDDGAGNQIGVAPGAKWIGCHNMDEGVGRPETYTECFQWFIAPTDLNGQNPDPTKRPHVMNNSWGCPTSELCAPDSLQQIVENTTAAGIFVEVSAGNSGSGCCSVNDPPAIYDASYSTGAMNTGAMSLAALQQPRARHGRRIEPDQARHLGSGEPEPVVGEHERLGVRVVLGHLDGRPARRRRRRAPLAGEAGARARHRGHEGAAEQHGEPERHGQQRHAVRRHRPRPEQPLRVRPRRCARRLQQRWPAATTSTASATATSTGAVGERCSASAGPLRGARGERRHVRVQLRRLLVHDGADARRGLPL